MAALSTFFLLLLISLVPALVTAGTVFDVELIPRDSPKSPMYNSSLTPFDRLQAAAHRSVNRARYLASRIAMKTSINLELGLHYDGEFLVGFSMGTPNPQAVFAILDTGSDLNWANCVGCQCFNNSHTLFNASASLSYKKLTCFSDECKTFRKPICREDRSCQYHMSYADGSNTDGILSADTFRFYSLDTKNFTSIPNMVFGCNFRSLHTRGKDFGSLLGLSPLPPSLIHQLAPKYISKYFSYCLNAWVEGGISSRLFLGRGKTPVAGKATVTPLITQDGYYAVQLNAVEIPGQFDIQFLRKSKLLSAGNIVFDSGAVLTYLDEDVVNALVNELTDYISLPTINPIRNFKLCYNVRSSEEEAALPGMWFEFAGTLGRVWVRPDNLYEWVAPGVKCMTIMVATNGIQIFGNLIQQNFVVGHDLEKMELTMVEKDCTKLYQP